MGTFVEFVFYIDTYYIYENRFLVFEMDRITFNQRSIAHQSNKYDSLMI
jgi:hypothetical protein